MSPVPPSDPAKSLEKSIAIESFAERSEVCAAESSSLYVNCKLTAPPCPDTERKPIDLVVVLDKSSSMRGQKLRLCKKTMKFLAEQLCASDRVGLVTYNAMASTDLHLTKMDAQGKASFIDKVKAIEEGLWTNLSAGMVAGLDEIQKPTRLDNDEPNPVQSVLLLTDGQANKGVKTLEGLAKMLQGMLQPHVSMHTFGYGSDHDAELLGKLADIGRGSYYFVQDVESVPLAFADCLGGILSVVAQTIKVEVIASPGVTISAIKTKRPVATIAEKVHLEMNMGDLFAEEKRDIMVELQLSPVTPREHFKLVEFRLRYANVLLSTLENDSTSVSIGRPEVVTNHAVNEDIVLQKQRILAAEAMEYARAVAEQGDLHRSREVLRSAMKRTMAACASLSAAAQAQANWIAETYETCFANLVSPDKYYSIGSGFLQQQAQSAWMQRQNNYQAFQPAMSSNQSVGFAQHNAPQAALLKRAYGSMN